MVTVMPRPNRVEGGRTVPPAEPLVFDLMVVGEHADEWSARATHALRADPHLRVSEVPLVLERLDLVVAFSADPRELRRVLDHAPAGIPVIVAGARPRPGLAALADVVVTAAAPAVLVEAARWLLGLPSWVSPARHSAVRRLMRH